MDKIYLSDAGPKVSAAVYGFYRWEEVDNAPATMERIINLQWMRELYKAYPDKEKFFDRSQSRQIGNIDGLAGTSLFKAQIIAGKSEKEIRSSWEPGLSQYKTMRKNYLLYP